MSQTEYAFRSSEGTVGPRDDRPLTEEEQKMVNRLLSDPFAFPIAYKQWLVAFIESSEMTLPMATIAGLNAALGVGVPGGAGLANLPAGLIFPYGGDIPPTGSLLCNGATYSRTTRAALFAAIGTKFGAPDGASFNVPNMFKKVPVGLDASDVDFDAIGKSGGEKTHKLSTAEIDHRHGSMQVGAADAAGSVFPAQSAGIASSGGDNLTVAHNNMQPFLVFNYIITHG